MAYDYDALYQTEKNALGSPNKKFTTFFAQHSKSALHVLDLGAGQGRDTLFIARAGHHVMAVDISPAGIADILSIAQAENLSIVGTVADICTYTPQRRYDVIVIDRTLHMLAPASQDATLKNILGFCADQGWVLIADEPRNMPRFKDTFANDPAKWACDKEEKGFLFMKRQSE
jgi:SAM-dependent methyltransferase